MKRILLLAVLFVFSIFLVSCEVFTISTTQEGITSTTLQPTTTITTLDIETTTTASLKELVVSEFEKKIIDLNIPNDNEKLVSLTSIFYTKLPLCESDACILKEKSVVLLELEIIRFDLNCEEQIEIVNNKYNIDYAAKQILIDQILYKGIYSGTLSNYTEEKNQIDTQMQQANITYQQKETAYETYVAMGVAIPSSIINYVSEYQEMIDTLTLQENELDRLWANLLEHNIIANDLSTLYNEKDIDVENLEFQRDFEIAGIRTEINNIIYNW